MLPLLGSLIRFDIEHYLDRGDILKDIVGRTGVTQQQISKIKRNLEAWGIVVAPYMVQGRPRCRTEEIEKTLTVWLGEKPLSYLFGKVYYNLNMTGWRVATLNNGQMACFNMKAFGGPYGSWDFDYPGSANGYKE